jgi:hypothetical protein
VSGRVIAPAPDRGETRPLVRRQKLVHPNEHACTRQIPACAQLLDPADQCQRLGVSDITAYERPCELQVGSIERTAEPSSFLQAAPVDPFDLCNLFTSQLQFEPDLGVAPPEKRRPSRRDVEQENQTPCRTQGRAQKTQAITSSGH